jgi:2-methylcitrate dehydratase PrpD
MGATEEKIARFIVETSDKDISPEAVESAKLGSFDSVGTMLAGAVSPPGKIMTKFIKEAGGKPESTVVGTGLRTTPVLGALANGTLAHALDYDDGGGFGHCSCVLLPPLISLGERMGASGKDILNAYVIGWRVGTSLHHACNYTQGERGFHGTSLYGVMAATAACARLLNLNVEQTIMALGTAGGMAGGILQNFGTYTKGLHAGQPDQNAVIACLLARDGWKSTDKVFESKAGFLHAYVGKDMYNLEAIRNFIDERPVTIERPMIKRYPCCHSNHSAVYSVISLLTENNISLEDIQQVDVKGMPYISHILFYPKPAYGFQGKFSIHYNVATAMIDKRVDLDSHTDEKLKRPQFRQALDKIIVHVMSPWDPDYNQRMPENPVIITLKDGRTFRKSTKRRDLPGSPENPLTEEALFGKFKESCGRNTGSRDIAKVTLGSI